MPKEKLTQDEIRIALLEALMHLKRPDLGVGAGTAKDYAALITPKEIHFRDWRTVLTQAETNGEIERIPEKGRIRITEKGRQIPGIRPVMLTIAELRPLICEAARPASSPVSAQPCWKRFGARTRARS